MSLSKATQQLSRALDKLENKLESSTMPLLRTRKRLDEREPRTDLTSREAAKLLGGTIGALMHMSDRESVRAALTWWAEQGDDAWDALELAAKPPKEG